MDFRSRLSERVGGKRVGERKGGRASGLAGGLAGGPAGWRASWSFGRIPTVTIVPAAGGLNLRICARRRKQVANQLLNLQRRLRLHLCRVFRKICPSGSPFGTGVTGGLQHSLTKSS